VRCIHVFSSERERVDSEGTIDYFGNYIAWLLTVKESGRRSERKRERERERELNEAEHAHELFRKHRNDVIQVTLECTVVTNWERRT